MIRVLREIQAAERVVPGSFLSLPRQDIAAGVLPSRLYLCSTQHQMSMEASDITKREASHLKFSEIFTDSLERKYWHIIDRFKFLLSPNCLKSSGYLSTFTPRWKSLNDT
jgi:hypothetical protein